MSFIKEDCKQSDLIKDELKSNSLENKKQQLVSYSEENVQSCSRKNLVESQSVEQISRKNSQLERKFKIRKKIPRNIRFFTTTDRARKVSQALYFQKRKQLQSIVLSLEEQKQRALSLEIEMEYMRNEVLKNTGKDLGSPLELIGDKYISIFVRDKSLEKNQIVSQYQSLISKLKQLNEDEMMNNTRQEDKMNKEPKNIESLILNIKNLCKDRLANEQQREKLSKQLYLMKNLVQQLQTRPNGLKKIILNEYKNNLDEDGRDPIDNDNLINELTVTLIQEQINECKNKFSNLENSLIEQKDLLNSAYIQIISLEKNSLKLENVINNELGKSNEISKNLGEIEKYEEKYYPLLIKMEKEKKEIELELGKIKFEFQNNKDELKAFRERNLELQHKLKITEEKCEKNRKLYSQETKEKEIQLQNFKSQLTLYKKQECFAR